MTYRAPDQSLEPGITKTLEGIDLIRSASLARIASEDRWQEGHINELSTLIGDLTNLEVRLRRLGQDTW